jgi:hypothetical protein
MRLLRRGIGAAGAGLVAALDAEAGAATLPGGWKRATIAAAVRFAVNGCNAAAVPARAATLA